MSTMFGTQSLYQICLTEENNEEHTNSLASPETFLCTMLCFLRNPTTERKGAKQRVES